MRLSSKDVDAAENTPKVQSQLAAARTRAVRLAACTDADPNAEAAEVTIACATALFAWTGDMFESVANAEYKLVRSFTVNGKVTREDICMQPTQRDCEDLRPSYCPGPRGACKRP